MSTCPMSDWGRAPQFLFLHHTYRVLLSDVRLQFMFKDFLQPVIHSLLQLQFTSYSVQNVDKRMNRSIKENVKLFCSLLQMSYHGDRESVFVNCPATCACCCLFRDLQQPSLCHLTWLKCCLVAAALSFSLTAGEFLITPSDMCMLISGIALIPLLPHPFTLLPLLPLCPGVSLSPCGCL